MGERKGSMEGKYHYLLLDDLRREGLTNTTLQLQHDKVDKALRGSAAYFASERYPLSSEFEWDNTGQEEIYVACNHCGHTNCAETTLNTLQAVMINVPNWAYAGAGRSYWDLIFAGQDGDDAVLERILGHYKASQSALPLLYHFAFKDPTDVYTFRAAYSGVLGALAGIDEEGFTSMGFHADANQLRWDPLTGDKGTAMALDAQTNGAYVVKDDSLGGWAGFGAVVKEHHQTGIIEITPTDSFRLRAVIAPVGLCLQLDSGWFERINYHSKTHKIVVHLSAANDHTPKARLRFQQTKAAGLPVGSGQFVLQGAWYIERETFVIPLAKGRSTEVVLEWKMDEQEQRSLDDLEGVLVVQ